MSSEYFSVQFGKTKVFDQLMKVGCIKDSLIVGKYAGVAFMFDDEGGLCI